MKTNQEWFATKREAVYKELTQGLSKPATGGNKMSAREKAESSAKMPPEVSGKLRTLPHDLSNSIETILQASYLLSQIKLDDDAKKCTDLIDKARRDRSPSAAE